MLHIRLCLIHKGGMRGKHLRKGLFPSQPFTREVVCSGWWHVVMIVPPSITLTVLIILIITPPLALDSGSDSCCSHTNPIVVADSD